MSARTNVYTLDKHGGLLAVQEAMVRKIVSELRAVRERLLRDLQRALFRRRHS